MPASVSRGGRTLYVAKDLRLSTAGSTYADGKAILADGFSRMLAVVQMDHAMSPWTAATPASPRSPASKWPSTLRTTSSSSGWTSRTS
ncbi:beta-hexosaminidase 3-like [Lolium rigidum]|uniref:beta-hexosaminidase 3-like n=1 Tax=Lolium rigidum TaxID=89674 RepID=UPI001F5C3C29|nr:beta-hexosaminidase 3-like [Lolium rigidum]